MLKKKKARAWNQKFEIKDETFNHAANIEKVAKWLVDETKRIKDECMITVKISNEARALEKLEDMGGAELNLH